MSTTTTATNHEGGNITIALDRIPNKCPLCGRHCYPRLAGASVVRRTEPVRFDVSFQCPACTGMFIGYYAREETASNRAVFERTAPVMPTQVTQSKEITGLSSDFVEIYNQASAAEAYGLREVAGMCYRKALEFLIKDFLISKAESESEKEEIRGEFLGTCIKTRVANDGLKACAVRATWLGNDETHYVRRWKNHGLDDLKDLVRASVDWIELQLVTERLAAEMPDPKKGTP